MNLWLYTSVRSKRRGTNAFAFLVLVFLLFVEGGICLLLWDPHYRVLVCLYLCFVLLCLNYVRPHYRILAMGLLCLSYGYPHYQVFVYLCFCSGCLDYPVLGHITRHSTYFKIIKHCPWILLKFKKRGLISTYNCLEESEILGFAFINFNIGLTKIVFILCYFSITDCR